MVVVVPHIDVLDEDQDEKEEVGSILLNTLGYICLLFAPLKQGVFAFLSSFKTMMARLYILVHLHDRRHRHRLRQSRVVLAVVVPLHDQKEVRKRVDKTPRGIGRRLYMITPRSQSCV